MIEFISNEILMLTVILLLMFYIILNYIYSKSLTVFSEIRDILIDENDLSLETNKLNKISQKVESDLGQSLSKITQKSNKNIYQPKSSINIISDFSSINPDARAFLAKLYEENPEIINQTIDDIIKDKKESDIQHLYG